MDEQRLSSGGRPAILGGASNSCSGKDIVQAMKMQWPDLELQRHDRNAAEPEDRDDDVEAIGRKNLSVMTILKLMSMKPRTRIPSMNRRVRGLRSRP